MKKVLLLIAITTIPYLCQAQKPYITSDGEIILGFARIDQNGSQESSTPRFSTFFHGQSLAHFDQTKNFGWFTGLTIRNVGFIYDQSPGIRKKFRTYNVGIPLGIKIGDVNGLYVFGGYELELPFNYKEKTFINEKKEDKFNVWFSRRVPTLYNTVFVGVRFPRGMSLKFKYYLTPFFNKNYTQVVNGVTETPFANLEVNTFHIALTTMITKGKKVVWVKRE
ncbi:MAG: hypothetical protein JNM78_15270 [Cyclobacteriaceae bacterium]|nr:hypothetical protein [Cyclobacteriaceae bacterium]